MFRELNETEMDLIFEAAYIYANYFKGQGGALCPAAEFVNPYGVAALQRILSAAGLDSQEKTGDFIKTCGTTARKNRAEALYSTLTREKEAFFSRLTEAELFVYHSANFDVSFTYGVNLAGALDFSGKSVLDIGGSTGGLCAGIKSVYETVSCKVFDTAYAIEAAHTGDFVEGDFFAAPLQLDQRDYVILSNVLHDWDNLDAIRILMNMAPVISRKTKLIIHEDLLSDSGVEPFETVLYGLRLCANVPGGRQRTRAELEELLKLSYKWYKGIDEMYSFGPHTAVVVSFI